MILREPDIIEYKIAQSKDNLKAAEALIKISLYLDCANRLYYAAFHILQAYLISVNVRAKSHNGVRIFVHKTLKQNELISNEEAKLFDELFDNRSDADYADFVIFNNEQVNQLLIEAKTFVNKK